MRKKLTTAEKTLIALGFAALIGAFFAPEVRRMLHLEKAQTQTKQTGDASTKGANSPATTGDNNKIQYNQQAPPVGTKKTKE